MTTTTNTPSLAESIVDTGTLTESAKQSAIDAMVSGRSNAAGIFTEQSKLEGQSESLYDGTDREFSDEELFAIAQDTAKNFDPERDYNADFGILGSRLQEIAARLDEVRFDPRTGERTHVLTGPNRTRLEAQARGLESQQKLSAFTALAVEKARAERQDVIDAANNEKALRMAWTGHDAKRIAALDDALLRIEADELARKVIELRRR